MSRIGKLPIKVPNDIEVEIKDSAVKISKGALIEEYDVGDKFVLKFENSLLVVSPKDEEKKKEVNNFYGLHRNNLSNIVKGMTEPFKVVLEINGVGFKASVIKENLILTLGYSHDIAFALPKAVLAKVEGNQIALSSANKQLVGQVAADIITLRKPEPYKGKGVKILGKPILRKEGKKK